MAPLFESVVYYIPECVPSDLRIDLSRLLDENGAAPAESVAAANHIITTGLDFPGVDSIPDTVPKITVSHLAHVIISFCSFKLAIMGRTFSYDLDETKVKSSAVRQLTHRLIHYLARVTTHPTPYTYFPAW